MADTSPAGPVDSPFLRPDSSGVWSKGGMRWNDIIAHAIHDARNHVLSLLASIDFLRSELGPETNSEVLEELGSMKASSRQLALLLNEALASSRYDTLEVIGSNQQLSEIVESSVHQLRQYAQRSRGVSLLLEPGTGSAMVSEGLLLRRMIDNLLHSAIQRSPVQGVVQVGWEVEGQNLEVYVSDQGVGLELQPVEEPTQQGALPDDLPGLQWRFCRAVAAACGGEFVLRSGRDGGVSALLKIPVSEDTETQGQVVGSGW